MRPLALASARLLGLLVVLAWAAPVRAGAEPTAAELLPASTAVYLEVEQPKELLGLLLDHPLRQRLEQSPDIQKALDDPKFKEFRAVVAAVEARWRLPCARRWRRLPAEASRSRSTPIRRALVILSRG